MAVLTEGIEDPQDLVVDTNVTTEDQKIELDEKEKNWRAFLEKRKEEQKQLEDERRKNKELESERSRREKEVEDLKIAIQTLVDKKDNNSSYDSEDDSDHKKLIQDEVNRIISKNEDERKKAEFQQRVQKESIEIKEQMPDLLEVCSHDNLAYLEYYHPEIAIPLAAMPDGFQKTKLAYQAVKKHVKMGTKEKEKIEKNLAKPKSLHSSLSNESQQEDSSAYMSDKKRQDTWNKMQRLMSGQDED